MKGKISLIFTIVFFVGSLFGGGALTANAATIELTYATHMPVQHAQTIVAFDWVKEIEKRTQGKVKIKTFPGGSLVTAPQLYDGVLKGISDIGMSCFAYTRGRFPVMEALDLPLGYIDGK